MFILRFVGRILSIGFILFIMFVLSGKSARAGAGWPAAAAAPAHGEADMVEAFVGASSAFFWSRPRPRFAQGCLFRPAQK